MHEATIASNILDAVALKLAAHPGTEACAVSVLIGEFRNVDSESLIFAFDAIKESVAGCQNCTLNIQVSNVVALCRESGHKYSPSAAAAFICPCGSAMGEILTGGELDILGYTLELVESPMPGETVCTK